MFLPPIWRCLRPFLKVQECVWSTTVVNKRLCLSFSVLLIQSTTWIHWTFTSELAKMSIHSNKIKMDNRNLYIRKCPSKTVSYTDHQLSVREIYDVQTEPDLCRTSKCTLHAHPHPPSLSHSRCRPRMRCLWFYIYGHDVAILLITKSHYSTSTDWQDDSEKWVVITVSFIAVPHKVVTLRKRLWYLINAMGIYFFSHCATLRQLLIS